jgi:hypothetical protein
MSEEKKERRISREIKGAPPLEPTRITKPKPEERKKGEG